MPTKRRFLLFLIVLTVMLLIKYAVSQELGQTTVGWKDETLSMQDTILTTLLYGTFFGGIAGIARFVSRHRAAQAGEYFNGDLVTVRLDG